MVDKSKVSNFIRSINVGMHCLINSWQICTSVSVLEKLLYQTKFDKLCCHEIVSQIRLKKVKGNRLNTLANLYIQVIGEEVTSNFPDLPGLQQNPHTEICVLVCLYLPYCMVRYIDHSLDRAMSLLSDSVSWIYLLVSQSIASNYLVHEYVARATNHRVIRITDITYVCALLGKKVL